MRFLPPAQSRTPLAMIVAGGQTGVDRAALDWAIREGIPHGGWCPRGRRAEDGPIPARYHLQETQGTQYAQRTAWNVRDSDGTVIFTVEPHLRGGTKRTMEFIREYRKPWLRLNRTLSVEACAGRLRDFLVENRVSVLNVAGSRASEEHEAGIFATDVLAAVKGLLERPMELADDSA